MKILDLSAVVPGVKFPPKSGTFQFLQDAYTECISEVVTSRIGPYYDSTKGYILNGCLNSGSGSNYNISAGSIFLGGQIYLVAAASFSISGSNVAVGAASITPYTTNADPVTFTDGVSRNVHNIVEIAFQPGLAGSGLVNFNDLINLAYKPVGAIGQTIMWTMPGSGSQNTLLPNYFDPSSGNGIHPLTMGWTIDTDLSGYVPAGYKAGDADYGTIGNQLGNDKITLTTDQLPAHTHSMPMNDSTLVSGSGPSLYAGAGQTSVRTANTGNVGSGEQIDIRQKTFVKLYIKRIQ